MSRSASPSLQELEDTLYDILAAGVDPGAAPGTLEAVQILLHEHARSPKSALELQAFFEAHGLSTTRSYHAPPDAFTMPTIELPDVDPGPAAISGNVDPSQLAAFAPQSRESAFRRWALPLCILALSGVTAVAIYTTLSALRLELATVRAESASQQQALATVRAEAQTLRTTLTETTELAQTAEKKSELLLQTYASPLDLNALAR